jgi:hypothetical protein
MLRGLTPVEEAKVNPLTFQLLKGPYGHDLLSPVVVAV